MILTKEDYIAINKAISDGDKVWGNDVLKPLKDKMKVFLRDFQTETCCYCQRNTKGEFKMVLDIEHILPKKHYPKLMFEILNLAVACKKCNMLIKKADLSFINNIHTFDENLFNKEDYKFIHPNLDTYENHIKRISVEFGTNRFVKYLPVDNNKGQYTYDYFRLEEWEIDSLNVMQGIENTKIDYENIKKEVAMKIMEL